MRVCPADALAQARKSGAFTAEHEAFWAAARRAHGDGEGTRELVEVLLLHRHLAHQDVVDGLAAATGIGAARADVVFVEARRITEHRPSQDISAQGDGGSVPVPAQRVVSLTERSLGAPAAARATTRPWKGSVCTSSSTPPTHPIPTIPTCSSALRPNRSPLSYSKYASSSCDLGWFLDALGFTTLNPTALKNNVGGPSR